MRVTVVCSALLVSLVLIESAAGQRRQPPPARATPGAVAPSTVPQGQPFSVPPGGRQTAVTPGTMPATAPPGYAVPLGPQPPQQGLVLLVVEGDVVRIVGPNRRAQPADSAPTEEELEILADEFEVRPSGGKVPFDIRAVGNVKVTGRDFTITAGAFELSDGVFHAVTRSGGRVVFARKKADSPDEATTIMSTAITYVPAKSRITVADDMQVSLRSDEPAPRDERVERTSAELVEPLPPARTTDRAGAEPAPPTSGARDVAKEPERPRDLPPPAPKADRPPAAPEAAPPPPEKPAPDRPRDEPKTGPSLGKAEPTTK